LPRRKRAVYFLRHYPSIPFFNEDLPDFHRARCLVVFGLSSGFSEEIPAIISESFRVASLAFIGEFSSEIVELTDSQGQIEDRVSRCLPGFPVSNFSQWACVFHLDRRFA